MTSWRDWGSARRPTLSTVPSGSLTTGAEIVVRLVCADLRSYSISGEVHLAALRGPERPVPVTVLRLEDRLDFI